MNFFRNHKTIFIITGSAALLLCALIAVALHFYRNYHVTTVYVEGNTHYTNEEIRDMVMDGFLGDNSAYLSLKYRDKSIDGVPFISKMDITVVDPNTIRITVYEKATAGYVEYLDQYMYFDKDGVVIEASDERTKGIPLVTGLKFDHVVVKEPLPVEDPAIFKSILDITQLVNKYNLSIDRMYFAKDGTLTLYFEDVRVSLGQPENLDEKVMHLQYILPEIQGRAGTLRMENYTEDTKNISFEPDDVKEGVQQDVQEDFEG